MKKPYFVAKMEEAEMEKSIAEYYELSKLRQAYPFPTFPAGEQKVWDPDSGTLKSVYLFPILI